MDLGEVLNPIVLAYFGMAHPSSPSLKATVEMDQETLSKLNKTFKVQGIPSLIILDGDGKLVTKDGRESVSKDPTGEDMPWPLGMTV